MYWVVRTSVVPWLLSWRSLCQMRWRAWGSRPVVGSSATMTRGRLIRARAMSRRLFMPVDRSEILLAALASSSTKRSSSTDAGLGLPAADVEETGEDDEVLEDGQVVVEVDLLGDDAGDLLEGPVVDRRGVPGDRQGPRGQGRDAVDHAHGRRLAGAVRAEEAEALALEDLEVDAVHGDEVAVLLGQLDGRDERGHGGTFHILASRAWNRVWLRRASRSPSFSYQPFWRRPPAAARSRQSMASSTSPASEWKHPRL